MPKTSQRRHRDGTLGAETNSAGGAAPFHGSELLQQTPVSTSTPFGRSPRDPFGVFTSREISGSALYTPEQRRRRDLSVWTLVQGILAPVQFAAFLISLVLVIHYLAVGRGLDLANASVIVKTVALYTIMITGCIWERDVFGCFLFARPFFWEDVFSMLVLALHTSYLFALFTGALSPSSLMLLALCAYATYLVNATQFVLKLRAARLQDRSGVLGWGAAS